jgi:hypothetical protein
MVLLVVGFQLVEQHGPPRRMRQGVKDPVEGWRTIFNHMV